MQTEVLNRLDKVERKYRSLKKVTGALVFILFGLFIGLGFTKTDKFDIIRAKGIVIEDANGKERILIGAPLPYSKDRVRTDTNLVRAYFANKIDPKKPDRYMEYYKNYRHQAYGMVVMNDKGIDVLQVGDKLSDANTGRRIEDIAGMLWNNQNGMELGGVGVFTSEEGKSSTGISFDDPTTGGSEALKIGVDDDGTKTINLIDTQEGEFILGFGKPKTELFKVKTA